MQKHFGENIYVRSKFSCVRSSHDLCARIRAMFDADSNALMFDALMFDALIVAYVIRELREIRINANNKYDFEIEE